MITINSFKERYIYKVFDDKQIEIMKYVVRNSDKYKDLESKIILDFGNYIENVYPGLDFTLYGRTKSKTSYLNKLNKKMCCFDKSDVVNDCNMLFDQFAWTLVVREKDVDFNRSIAYGLIRDFFNSEEFCKKYRSKTFDMELKEKSNGYRAFHLSVQSDLLPYFFIEFHAQSLQDYLIATFGDACHESMEGKDNSLRAFCCSGSTEKSLEKIRASLPDYRVYSKKENGESYIYNLCEAECFYKYFQSNLDKEPELFNKFLKYFFDKDLKEQAMKENIDSEECR